MTFLAIYESGLRAVLQGTRRWLARGAAGSRQVGPYLVECKLGAGAMGEVYRARTSDGAGELALKLLPHGASARERARFEQEARLGAEVCHPNVAATFAHGDTRDGTRYIAMELVEGETLEQLVEREGPLPAARSLRIAAQLCAALEHLHGRGLVHRDIKPANVIVTGAGHDRVKVVDFGLVERVGQALEPDAIVGTPLYISPEAIVAPHTVDARSDVYALGAVLYFLLCGVPVFDGQSVLEVCTHHLHSRPQFPSSELGRSIPVALERIVLDCLAKNPAARPPSARALARRLAACLVPAAVCPSAALERAPARRPTAADRRPCAAIDAAAATGLAIALGSGARSGIRCASGDPSMNHPGPASRLPLVPPAPRGRAGEWHGAAWGSAG